MVGSDDSFPFGLFSGANLLIISFREGSIWKYLEAKVMELDGSVYFPFQTIGKGDF